MQTVSRPSFEDLAYDDTISVQTRVDGIQKGVIVDLDPDSKNGQPTCCYENKETGYAGWCYMHQILHRSR